MPGVPFDPFDVVVVPFPFTDRQAAKRRPALVVSGRDFNSRHGQLILAMITAARRSDWPSDTSLEEWRSAGLTVPCRVRLKLFTLDSELIIRRIGTLSDLDKRAVGAALKRFLAAG
jgi:mRNA interferase MazF